MKSVGKGNDKFLDHPNALHRAQPASPLWHKITKTSANESLKDLISEDYTMNNGLIMRFLLQLLAFCWSSYGII